MNPENNKAVVRAVIEGEAKLAYDKMVSELKSENHYIKITPSKLVNWVIKRYYESTFSNEKALIIKGHFNSKEYLKEAIRNASSQEQIEKILKETLEKLANNPSIGEFTPTKRRGRKPKSILEALETHSVEESSSAEATK